jgi:hypothetical protein
MITLDDLASYGITPQSGDNSDAENRKFLNLVHQTFYEFVVFVSHRNWRKKVIEKHKDELEEGIKDILLNIAAAIEDSGQFNGLWDGTARLDNGDFTTKSLQERLVAVIPPMVWQQILSLEPDIMFAGGEI